MATKQSSFKIGRSAVTGKFEPVKKAETHKRSSVVETIKRPAPTKKK